MNRLQIIVLFIGLSIFWGTTLLKFLMRSLMDNDKEYNQFKDDKWLKTSSAEQQWFESKVVGDTLKKEECEKVVFDPALF